MKEQKSFEDLYSYICNNSSEIDPELEAAKKEMGLSNKIKFIACLAFDIAMLRERGCQHLCTSFLIREINQYY